MQPNDVVIVSAVRTPFGRFDGVLRSILSIDLGVKVLQESVRRIGLDPALVDEVYYGTCIPAEYAIYTNVPARQIPLLAGLPETSSVADSTRFKRKALRSAITFPLWVSAVSFSRVRNTVPFAPGPNRSTSNLGLSHAA